MPYFVDCQQLTLSNVVGALTGRVFPSKGGNELIAGTPEELGTMLAGDHARWGRIIKEQGVLISNNLNRL